MVRVPSMPSPPAKVQRSMERPETARRLSYQPALDGLRAVALLGVVAYHAGIDEMRGGFLGVSSFFTLSGFLITSLLVVERTETGRIGLATFWVRRLRRLFPAALVTIGATVLVAAVFADDSQLARLRADALASLFHFSNWRFIADFNPFFYLIDGFRYGFIGHADGSLAVGAVVVLVVNVGLWALTHRMFAVGYRLKP